MEKDEIKKGITKAGKSLKQAGYAFILIPIVALIIEVISAQEDINFEDIKNIVIVSKIIYSILFIVIASCLISAGNILMGRFSEINEYEKSMKDPAEIKKQTMKLGELEVITEDLGKMKWEGAKNACGDLMDGWRLPTKDELNILYENKEKIGGITNGYYWSSTEYDNRSAWGQSFANGYQNRPNLYKYGNVRAVRTI